MTRVNVGVDPKDLCDQHLIAEYRELPRVWGFSPVSKAPNEFCLGKGHMLWCAKFPGLLYDRYISLVNEMLSRGFHVSFPDPPERLKNGARPTESQIDYARSIVIVRIKEREASMRRKPRRTSPS